MKPPTLREIARGHLDWLRKKGGKAVQAELYCVRGEEREIERREGRPHSTHFSSSEGMGLRLLTDHKEAFAAADGLDANTLETLFKSAASQLGSLEPDPSKNFPKKEKAVKDPALAASLEDADLFKTSLESLVPKLEEMEAAALAADRRIKKVLRSGCGQSRSEFCVANTSGLSACESESGSHLGLSVLAEDQGESQVGSAMESSRKAAVLNFQKAGREAAARAAMLLGGKKLPSRRRAVVFDPWACGEFLDLIAGLLCADEIQRGKSLLAGRLNARVGSGLATFIDDPRLLGGLASSLYDDEGVPTRKKAMIERGVVKEFFYDSSSAKKDGRRSNGSAVRNGAHAPPSPGSSNFYLAPGKISREELIKKTKDGILVYELMGMHMADPISGEFSVGASGLAIQDGKIGGAVKSAMISGNLLELLKKIDLAAGDLTFYGPTGAPTFRVSDLAVA